MSVSVLSRLKTLFLRLRRRPVAQRLVDRLQVLQVLPKDPLPVPTTPLQLHPSPGAPNPSPTISTSTTRHPAQRRLAPKETTQPRAKPRPHVKKVK